MHPTRRSPSRSARPLPRFDRRLRRTARSVDSASPREAGLRKRRNPPRTHHFWLPAIWRVSIQKRGESYKSLGDWGKLFTTFLRLPTGCSLDDRGAGPAKPLG